MPHWLIIPLNILLPLSYEGLRFVLGHGTQTYCIHQMFKTFWVKHSNIAHIRLDAKALLSEARNCANARELPQSRFAHLTQCLRLLVHS